MLDIREAIGLAARQAGTAGNPGATATDPHVGTPGYCDNGNEYDGAIGARISSIFVILVGSVFGALFPVIARRTAESSRILAKAFFAAKYFGSGVIIATAFIHLLAPANEALTNPCLTGVITEYSWAEGIALMTIFSLFFLEIMTMRYATFGHNHNHEHDAENRGRANSLNLAEDASTVPPSAGPDPRKTGHERQHQHRPSHVRGEDHLGHSREHTANEDLDDSQGRRWMEPEGYAAQMTAIFILEFGVVFHSIFIGLTLAVAGAEFKTLYVVLVFHQTFEGLGLGTRLAAAPWPKSKKWTPYWLGLGYAISTPIAIAVGLGVRKSYAPGSQTALITNGLFDSVSAGILIYTGLVELMAHEFMFSPTMQRARIGTVMSAFILMCLGAGLMALLGKWA